jgi:NitT/TauT family transport system substrate-binding protein
MRPLSPAFIRSTLLAMMSLVFIMACQPMLNQPNQADIPTFRVSFDLWPGYYPLAIAQAKGFFKQQGVAVEFTLSENGGYIPAFANNQLDIAFTTIGNAVILASENPQAQVVGLIDESQGADVVLADPSINHIDDLKGHPLGVKISQFGELFVREILKAKEIAISDVRFIDTPASDVPTALAQGSIIAGHTWEPFISEALKAGNRILFTSKDTPGLIADVIVVRQTIANQYPEATRAFLKAWFQAVDYWQAHPDESNAIIAQAFSLKPTEISLEGIKMATLNDNTQAFSKSNTTPSSLHHVTKLYQDFFIQSGSLPTALDIEQFLTSAYLTSAKSGLSGSFGHLAS